MVTFVVFSFFYVDRSPIWIRHVDNYTSILYDSTWSNRFSRTHSRPAQSMNLFKLNFLFCISSLSIQFVFSAVNVHTYHLSSTDQISIPRDDTHEYIVSMPLPITDSIRHNIENQLTAYNPRMFSFLVNLQMYLYSLLQNMVKQKSFRWNQLIPIKRVFI